MSELDRGRALPTTLPAVAWEGRSCRDGSRVFAEPSEPRSTACEPWQALHLLPQGWGFSRSEGGSISIKTPAGLGVLVRRDGTGLRERPALALFELVDALLSANAPPGASDGPGEAAADRSAPAGRRATAVERLICKMLRGPHVQTFELRDLATYVYRCGLTLHNLPYLLTGDELALQQLQQIEALDPQGGAQDRWGPWAVDFAGGFQFELPPLSEPECLQRPPTISAAAEPT